MYQRSRLIRLRTVTSDGGDGLVSHAGIAWLGETADLSELTAGLSAAMAGIPQRRHDPGRTLTQMVLALADGATCLSDLAAFRAQPAMFDPTPPRRRCGAPSIRSAQSSCGGIATARAAARERAWAAGAGPATDEVVIDIDSTIITTKADKQDAAPTYKRTCGHHPLLAICTDTDEVLAGILRPGNAGANTAADHIVVLADALDRLPAAWRTGHAPGDDPALAQRRILVRCDAGGASHWLAEECVERNIEFSLGYPIDERVHDGVICVPTGCWHPATNTDGTPRDGAEVVELTTLVTLDGWPDGTRLIVRRERPHPGAQLTLFDTIQQRGFRRSRVGGSPGIDAAGRTDRRVPEP